VSWIEATDDLPSTVASVILFECWMWRPVSQGMFGLNDEPDEDCSHQRALDEADVRKLPCSILDCRASENPPWLASTQGRVVVINAIYIGECQSTVDSIVRISQTYRSEDHSTDCLRQTQTAQSTSTYAARVM